MIISKNESYLKIKSFIYYLIQVFGDGN